MSISINDNGGLFVVLFGHLNEHIALFINVSCYVTPKAGLISLLTVHKCCEKFLQTKFVPEEFWMLIKMFINVCFRYVYISFRSLVSDSTCYALLYTLVNLDVQKGLHKSCGVFFLFVFFINIYKQYILYIMFVF